MGVNCKPVGKFQSTMKKMENELERQRKLAKENRENKKRGKK